MVAKTEQFSRVIRASADFPRSGVFINGFATQRAPFVVPLTFLGRIIGVFEVFLLLPKISCGFLMNGGRPIFVPRATARS